MVWRGIMKDFELKQESLEMAEAKGVEEYFDGKMDELISELDAFSSPQLEKLAAAVSVNLRERADVDTFVDDLPF
jgi:hypothetical protein